MDIRLQLRVQNMSPDYPKLEVTQKKPLNSTQNKVSNSCTQDKFSKPTSHQAGKRVVRRTGPVKDKFSTQNKSLPYPIRHTKTDIKVTTFRPILPITRIGEPWHHGSRHRLIRRRETRDAIIVKSKNDPFATANRTQRKNKTQNTQDTPAAHWPGDQLLVWGARLIEVFRLIR